MLGVIVRRLALLPLILLGVATLTFVIVAISPFDPIRAYVGAETPISAEGREEIARAWGLDQSEPERMIRWAGRLLQGDLGHSTMLEGRPVSEALLERAGPTLVLIGTSLALVLVGGLIAGVLAAAFRDSWFDWLVRSVSHFNIAAPSFWVALMALYIFSVQLNWLPAAGTTDLRGEGGTGIDLKHLILPAVTLAITQQAWFTMYIRNTLLEVMREDYVQYATAQGIGRTALLLRHALPNALIPFVTLIGVNMGEIIGGSILIETVFAWPGLGTLTRDAALSADLPLLIAITIIGAFFVIMGNLFADVSYRVLDPRIRETGA